MKTAFRWIVSAALGAQLALLCGFTVPPSPNAKKMQEKLTELAGGSGWQFSSSTALDIVLDNYLTARPAGTTPQGALNTLLGIQSSLATSEQDSMIATFCVVADDQSKEWFNDSLFVNAAPSNVRMRIRDMLRLYGIKVGLSISAYYVEHGDTVNAILSASKIRALRKNDGWEVGSGGWDEKVWFNSNTHNQSDKFAKGDYTQGQMNAAMDLHFSGNVRALVDTLGLTDKVRFHSHSNTSAWSGTEKFMARAGIDYGVSGATDAASPLGGSSRPNYLYPLDCARWGRWGTGGTGAAGAKVSAIPFQHPHPYEIVQSIAESQDTSAVYKTFRFALQTKGLIVLNLHKFSTMETSMTDGQNSVKKLFVYIKALTDAGQLRVLVPSQAFDLYYKAPLSPSVETFASNFADRDGDTHIDWWFSGDGAQAASDTAMLVLKPGTIRHGGKRAYSLNWAANAIAGNGQIIAVSGSIDSTYEQSFATMGVVPPAGGGWTAQFDIWAICDSFSGWVTLGGANDKELGITFYSPVEERTNQIGTTNVPNFFWLYPPSNYNFAFFSSLPVGQIVAPFYPYTSNTVHFAPINCIDRSVREWTHLTACYDIPEFADYLLIALWKNRKFPANEVIVSDYKLTFFRRSNQFVWP